MKRKIELLEGEIEKKKYSIKKQPRINDMGQPDKLMTLVIRSR